MKLDIIYFFFIGLCLEYTESHEKHVKVQIPKLVHKHKHHVVVHEKGDDKKHIVIHKHEHKHHHKHEHGHKHGHKHKAEHKHKHEAKHSHKHEAKHNHKHEAKHQHKHEAKHKHKHEAKHQHKAEHKHSHKHKASHKHHAEHKHSHKHHGKHEHKHHGKHEHKHKHIEKGKKHEKVVLDVVEDGHHGAYIADPGYSQELSYAPYQLEGDYEDYQQPQNEEQVVEDDDHDNLENYDEDFDSPSENIENYDDTDIDFLSAKPTYTTSNSNYNYNGAIIGEVLKNTYAAQESPVAVASNKVVQKLTVDPWDSFENHQDFFEANVKMHKPNKKYESLRSVAAKAAKAAKAATQPWIPVNPPKRFDSSPAGSSNVETKLIPTADSINMMVHFDSSKVPTVTTTSIPTTVTS